MNASSYLFKLPSMMLSEYHQLGSCSKTILIFLLLVVLSAVRIIIIVIFVPIDMSSFSPTILRGGSYWLQAVGVLATAPRVIGAMSKKLTVGMSLSAASSFKDLFPQSVNVHFFFVIVAIVVDPSFFLVSLIVQIPLSATISTT